MKSPEFSQQEKDTYIEVLEDQLSDAASEILRLKAHAQRKLPLQSAVERLKTQHTSPFND